MAKAPAKSNKKVSAKRPLSQKSPGETPELTAVTGSGAAVRFKIGGKVSHRVFGNGVIDAIDGEKLRIDFKKVGTKWIIDAFVKPL
jgi:hypothetical protein